MCLSDPESFLSSDTCPETPDGSLKEEVDSPDTGAYICLWDCCNEEFESQKLFVDHLNEAHTETKKGCDEFPCLWKVIFHFCRVHFCIGKCCCCYLWNPGLITEFSKSVIKFFGSPTPPPLRRLVFSFYSTEFSK